MANITPRVSKTTSLSGLPAQRQCHRAQWFGLCASQMGIYWCDYYLYNDIGKYALGSCGAGSACCAAQRLYGVGRDGGSFDSE